MTAFLHSFWFHMLVAAAIMAMGFWLSIMGQALGFNTLLWPARELIHKIRIGNWRGFFTGHVTLEWGAPVAVGWLLFGVLQ